MSHTRLQLLANSSLRWFFLRCLLTSFGAGISYLVLSWAILKVNDSVAAIAVLMLCFWLSNVFFGPWLGVLADRYSRKWLVVCANGMRGSVLIVFGVVFHHIVSIHLIYILMICLGLGFSLYLPATIALIREIVEPEDLLYTNSMTNMAYELGFAMGMGTAGFIVSAFSVPVSVWVTGILFIISTVAILMVKVTPAPVSSQILSKNIHENFKMGIAYLCHNKKLIVIYSVQLLLMVAFMTTPILLAPFAKNVLHASASQFGAIEAALSVGIIVGGFFMPWVAKHIGLYYSSLSLCFFLSISFVWFAFNRQIDIAELIYFCLGVGLSVWPLLVTQGQNLTNLDFQARVQSVFNSLSGILILGIYLLVDVGSHFIAIEWLYFFEVFLGILAAFILWRCRTLLQFP